MKNISFLTENFQFLEVKFSIYLNKRFFLMVRFLTLQLMYIPHTDFSSPEPKAHKVSL